MENLTANFLGKFERRVLNGRSYLVVPMTILQPQVLNGSKGALYYPQDEVERHPGLWNGVPIVNGHPRDESGRPVSARDPGVLEKYGLGWQFNDRIDNGKRIVDGWFDEQLTQKKAPKTYDRIINGQPSELSTGLYTDDFPAQNGATINGTPFSYYARNYRPDHLAVLEDEVGACSLKDGCGVLVGNEEEATEEEVAENLGKYGNIQSKNTGKFKKFGAGSGTGEVHAAAQAGALTITDRHKELGADAAMQAGMGHNPPNWSVDEDKWEKAKASAEESGHSEDWPYIVAVYEKMGGTIEGKAENQLISNEDEDMKSRKEKAEFLTANCSCWKGKMKLLENKELLSDQDLDTLVAEVKANSTTENALKELKKVIGAPATLTINEMPGFMKDKMKKDDSEEEDMEEEDAPEEEMEENKKDNMQGGGYRKKKMATNSNNGTQTVNTQEIENGLAKRLGFQSVEHMGATLNAAREVELEKKRELVRKIVTANSSLSEDQRKVSAKNLLKKSIPELQEIAQFIPAGSQQQTYNQEEDLSFLSLPTTNYSGAAGGQITFVTENEEEVLNVEDEVAKDHQKWLESRRITARA